MSKSNNGNYYMQTPANNSGEFDIEKWATALKANPDDITLKGLNPDDSLSGLIGTTRLPSSGAAKTASRIQDWSAYDEMGYSPEEALGDNQKNLERFGNALLNNLVIAGSTAVQSSLGLAYGLMSALATGSSIWDNPVNNAMNEVQDIARTNNPIYHSREYNEKGAIGRLFTPEFWADNLQNLGFTEGMLISSLIPGALLKNAGQFANLVGRSLISSFGEASTEALQAKNDKKDLETKIALDSYNRERNSLSVLPESMREREENKLLYDLQDTISGIDQDANKVGNSVLYQNLAILTLTGIGEFAPFFSRGIKPSSTVAANKALKQGVTKTVDDAGRLAKVSLDEGKGLFVAKDVAKTLGRASLEGVEEFSQNIATKIGDIYAGYNSFNNSRFNPENRELATSLLQAGSMAIAEAVGDKDVWTEFLSGMVTGFTGGPVLRSTRDSDGNFQFPISLEGAVAEGIRDYKEYSKEAKRMKGVVSSVNERLQDPKYQEYYEHLTRDIDITEKMNKAIEDADAFNLKNYQFEKVISDISLFESLGLIDDYKETVASFANLDDQQLQNIVNETTVDGNGPFVENGRTMSIEEVRNKIKENSSYILDKIDKFIDIKNTANLYLNPKLSKNALENYIYGSMQIEDWSTRQAELLNELYDIYSKSVKNEDKISKEELFTKNADEVNKILSSIYSALNPNDQIEYNKKVDDYNKLNDSIKIFRNKISEVIKNPAKENRKAEAQTRVNEAEAKKFKTKNLGNQLATATSISDVRNIIADETIDPSVKSKALRTSTNQFVKDYNTVLQSINALRPKINSLNSVLKADINKILNNVIDNIESIEEFNSEGALMADPEILRVSDTETTDELETRAKKASFIIGQLMKDVDKDDATSTIIMPEDFSGAVDGEDLGDEGEIRYEEATTGSQNVPTAPSVNTNTSDTKASTTSNKTQVIEGVEETPDEGNSSDIYVDADSIDRNVENIEERSKESIRDVEENLSNKENKKETLIRPSTSQYDLTGMNPYVYDREAKRYATDDKGNRIPKDIEFNEIEPEASTAYTYLSQNGPEGKSAFIWINEGGLQKYLNDKGSLYIGIDPKFSETVPLIFIKNKDNSYSPIGNLYDLDWKIDSFVGLREITDKVKEEYSSNKKEDTVYVSPSVKIPAENVNISTGRVPYTNDIQHSLKDAIAGTEISSDNAEIIVIADGKLIGGTGKASDYRFSGNSANGMSYIAIPNARRGGFKGKTLVPIIPRTYAEAINNNGKIMSSIRALINELATYLKEGNKDKAKEYLNALSHYILLTNFDLVPSVRDDETGEFSFIYFKEVERDKTGNVIKVKKNGREVVKSKPISYISKDATIEEISAAISNALIKIQAPIRIYKGFVNDKGKNKSIIEDDLAYTYCPNLKSQAAYFTFTAPTVQQKPVEATSESKQDVNPTEPSASNDLFDLDNFGISDVIRGSSRSTSFNRTPFSPEQWLIKDGLINHFKGLNMLSKKQGVTINSLKEELAKRGFNPEIAEFKRTPNGVAVTFNYKEESRDAIKREIVKTMSSIKNVMEFLESKIPALKGKIHYNITLESASKILGRPLLPNENSFITKNGEIYLIGSRVTKDAAIEECLHLLTDSLIADNEKLASSLLKECKEAFPTLYSEIKSLYEGIGTQNRELLTQSLSRAFRKEYDTEQRSTVQSILSKFIDWLKNVFGFRTNPKTGNQIVELDMLPDNLTLTSLAKLINASDSEFQTYSNTVNTYFNRGSYKKPTLLYLGNSELETQEIQENQDINLTDFGYSEDWIDTATNDEITYARFCAGV